MNGFRGEQEEHSGDGSHGDVSGVLNTTKCHDTDIRSCVAIAQFCTLSIFVSKLHSFLNTETGKTCSTLNLLGRCVHAEEKCWFCNVSLLFFFV